MKTTRQSTIRTVTGAALGVALLWACSACEDSNKARLEKADAAATQLQSELGEIELRIKNQKKVREATLLTLSSEIDAIRSESNRLERERATLESETLDADVLIPIQELLLTVTEDELQRRSFVLKQLRDMKEQLSGPNVDPEKRRLACESWCNSFNEFASKKREALKGRLLGIRQRYRLLRLKERSRAYNAEMAAGLLTEFLAATTVEMHGDYGVAFHSQHETVRDLLGYLAATVTAERQVSDRSCLNALGW